MPSVFVVVVALMVALAVSVAVQSPIVVVIALTALSSVAAMQGRKIADHVMGLHTREHRHLAPWAARLDGGK